MHATVDAIPVDMSLSTSRTVDAGRVSHDIQNIGKQASIAAACRPADLAARSRNPLIIDDPVAQPNRSQSNDAGWSSQVAREAHNLEVAGSNPVPAILQNFAETSVNCYLPAFGSAA